MRLFISHASTDLEIAEALRLRLEEIPEVTCFLLSTDIFPGDDWEARIRKAAVECDAIACLVTPEYIKRPWFYAEWAAFWIQENKTWYLLMLGTSTDDVFEVMRRRQTADLSDRRSVEALFVALSREIAPSRAFDLLAMETVKAVKDAASRQILVAAKGHLSTLMILMRENEDNVSSGLVQTLLTAGKISEIVGIAKDEQSNGPTKRRQLAVCLVDQGYASAAAEFTHLIMNRAERRTVGRACLRRIKIDSTDAAAWDLLLTIYRDVRDPQRRDLRDTAKEYQLEIPWPDVDPNP
jgi:hypothetical protein